MTIKNSSNSYGSVTKFFHWLIFLLVAGMLVFGYFLDDIPREYAGFAYNIHKLTGMTILTLMILRLLWACVNVKPLLPPGTSIWERWAERAIHYALYIFLIAMPLAGWIGSSASGKGPHIGDFTLTLPVPRDKVLSHASFDVHNTVAVILIVLISIHILAALYHYFIRKDDVMRRMLPKAL